MFGVPQTLSANTCSLYSLTTCNQAVMTAAVLDGAVVKWQGGVLFLGSMLLAGGRHHYPRPGGLPAPQTDRTLHS